VVGEWTLGSDMKSTEPSAATSATVLPSPIAAYALTGAKPSGARKAAARRLGRSHRLSSTQKAPGGMRPGRRPSSQPTKRPQSSHITAYFFTPLPMTAI
jgi:hypothetical protein